MLNSLLPKGDKVFGKVSYQINKVKNLESGKSHLTEGFDFKNDRHLLLTFLSLVLVIAVNILVFTVKERVVGIDAQTPPVVETPPTDVGVLSLRYFPVDLEASGSAQMLDSTEAGFAEQVTIDAVRSSVDGKRDKTVESLNKASKYHGYKDPNAQPSLNYRVVEEKEFLKPVPVKVQTIPYNPPFDVPFADHFKILAGDDVSLGVSNICDYVENRGVKEVWIWMYHTDKVVPIESNMAPKTGGDFGTPGYMDISNSFRMDDLPRCAKTYTVYDFNYYRNVSLHNHGHQLEMLFGYADSEIFGKFNTFAQTSGPNACGTVHNPPNTQPSVSYVYNNEASVSSNCQNWKPDGSGAVETVNCHTWQGSGACNNNEDDGELKQRIWWMQNIPGLNNGLIYNGKPMKNWWGFVGDYDNPSVQPPSIKVTSPVDQARIRDIAALTVDANYPGGISKVEYYKDGETVPFASSTVAPFSAVMDVAKWTSGGHQIYAKAYANTAAFGDVAQTSKINITASYVDNRPPVVSVVSPEVGGLYTDSNIRFSFSVSDNVAANRLVAEVTGSGNGYRKLVDIASNQADFNLKLPDGLYTFTLSGVDINNIPSQVQFEFKVIADPDKDGFTSNIETAINTNALLACGVDAWPADLNNDKVVNSGDDLLMLKNYAPKGASNYTKRYDLNADGAVNSGDRLLLQKFSGKKCVDSGAVFAPQPDNVVNVDCRFTTDVDNQLLSVDVGVISNVFGTEQFSLTGRYTAPYIFPMGVQSDIYYSSDSLVGEYRMLVGKQYGSYTLCKQTYTFVPPPPIDYGPPFTCTLDKDTTVPFPADVTVSIPDFVSNRPVGRIVARSLDDLYQFDTGLLPSVSGMIKSLPKGIFKIGFEDLANNIFTECTPRITVQ